MQRGWTQNSGHKWSHWRSDQSAGNCLITAPSANESSRWTGDSVRPLVEVCDKSGLEEEKEKKKCHYQTRHDPKDGAGWGVRRDLMGVIGNINIKSAGNKNENKNKQWGEKKSTLDMVQGENDNMKWSEKIQVLKREKHIYDRILKWTRA